MIQHLAVSNANETTVLNMLCFNIIHPGMLMNIA
jgi:hypothetical protein